MDQLRDCQSLSEHTRHVLFIGAGHVGGISAVVMAAKNPRVQVTVVDRNKELIGAWNRGIVPFPEPRVEELLFSCDPHSDELKDSGKVNASRYDSGSKESHSSRLPNIAFSVDIATAIVQADTIFLCVNTPLINGQQAPGAEGLDISRLQSVCETIAQLRQQSRHGAVFDVFSNPEFLAQGTAVRDLLSPSRVIIGRPKKLNNEHAEELVSQLYSGWIPDQMLITMNTSSAELAKLASNSFIAQRISSINSLTAVCERTNADIEDVSQAIGLDPRVGPHALIAGFGYGGPCLAKDNLGLAHQAAVLGLEEVSAYWREVDRMNNHQIMRITNRILQQLPPPYEKCKVCILGLAFKANTTNVTNAPGVRMIKELLSKGVTVSVFEPCSSEAQVRCEIAALHDLEQSGNQLDVGGSLEDAYLKANCIMVHTAYPMFYDEQFIDWNHVARSMNSPKLYVSASKHGGPRDLGEIGFTVMQIGKQS